MAKEYKPKLTDIVSVMKEDAKELFSDSGSKFKEGVKDFARGVGDVFIIPTSSVKYEPLEFNASHYVGWILSGVVIGIGPFICAMKTNDSRSYLLYAIPAITNSISGMREWYKSAHERVVEHKREDPHFSSNGL